MKRLIYIIIIAILGLLALWIGGGLSAPETQPKDFNIEGMWIHTHSEYLDSAGQVKGESDERPRFYKIYTGDKVHKYLLRTYETGDQRLVPWDSESYLLMPDVDTLYAEGDIVIPIVEMHDTVLNILWHNTIQHWRRVTDVSEQRQQELAAYSDEVMKRNRMFDDRENLYEWYITARNKVRMQTYILLACLLLLLGGGYWMLWFYRRNRRLTAALADLQEEIKERPEAMRETTRRLSDELFASDWYLDLKRRAGATDASSVRFFPDDWAEIERQVRRLYPTFRNHLYSLHAFSETEYRVCLLLKLHFTPTEISTALCKDKSTVSAIRSRLYAKVFGTKGSSKAWDEFIEQI